MGLVWNTLRGTWISASNRAETHPFLHYKIICFSPPKNIDGQLKLLAKEAYFISTKTQKLLHNSSMWTWVILRWDQIPPRLICRQKVSVKRELQPACTKGIVVDEGGNNKVWCCFSYSGLGELVFIDGSINSEVFKDSSHTLKEYFPFREKFEP